MPNKEPETIKVELPKNSVAPRATINSISDLPNWFCLDSYKNAGNLDPVEWYNELNIRAHFYSTIDIDRNTDWLLNLPTVRKNKSQKLFFGKCDTNISLKSSAQEKAHKYIDCFCEEKSEALFTGLITPSLKANRMFFNKKPLRTFGEVLTFDVNLLTPDDILIERFKKWLAAERRSMITEQREKPNGETTIKRRSPFRNVITESDRILAIDSKKLRSWHQCGLLPLLDLHQWALINRFHIQNDVYGEAILLAPSDKGSRRISNTTYSHAEFVMQYIELLWNQINMGGNNLSSEKPPFSEGITIAELSVM